MNNKFINDAFEIISIFLLLFLLSKYEIIIGYNFDHFFFFFASFFPFPAGAFSAASFSFAFLYASNAAFFFFIIYSFFLTVSGSILIVVWQSPQ